MLILFPAVTVMGGCAQKPDPVTYLPLLFS